MNEGLPEEPTDDQLDIASTANLVKALERRSFGSVIILAYRHKLPDGSDDETKEWWIHGGHYMALGLIESVKFQQMAEEFSSGPGIPDDGGDDDWKNNLPVSN